MRIVYVFVSMEWNLIHLLLAAYTNVQKEIGKTTRITTQMAVVYTSAILTASLKTRPTCASADQERNGRRAIKKQSLGNAIVHLVSGYK